MGGRPGRVPGPAARAPRAGAERSRSRAAAQPLSSSMLRGRSLSRNSGLVVPPEPPRGRLRRVIRSSVHLWRGIGEDRGAPRGVRPPPRAPRRDPTRLVIRAAASARVSGAAASPSGPTASPSGATASRPGDASSSPETGRSIARDSPPSARSRLLAPWPSPASYRSRCPGRRACGGAGPAARRPRRHAPARTGRLRRRSSGAARAGRGPGGTGRTAAGAGPSPAAG
jgi:hypothetical protein